MDQHYYANKLEEHHKQVAAETWRSNLCNSLQHIYDNTDHYTDACILVGNERIYSHRLVLSLNSRMMEESEVWLDSDDKEGCYQVKLLEEFEEYPGVVRDIVRSFYNGHIDIQDSNLKIVYKFARCYEVKWLVKYAESVFDETIKLENFVDLFKFAQKFGAENNKLIESCLNHLDSNLLTGLYNTEHVYNLDFYCLRSITSSSFSLLSNVDLFTLITRWAEHDFERRKCNVEILLFDIKYHRITKSDLVDHVFAWLSSVQGLDDAIRGSLARIIGRRICEADIRQNFLTLDNIDSQGKSNMRVDRFVSEIVNATENKIKERHDSISSDAVLSVVQYRLTQAEPYTRQCILEYISDHNTINRKNVTHFLKAFEINRDMDLKWIIQKFLTISNLNSVEWSVLPSDLIRVFLHDLGTSEMEFLKLECIMRWAEKNPGKGVELRELLRLLVCYHKVPEEYLTLVLKPHLTQLLPDTTTVDLTCGIHPPESMVHHEEQALTCLTTRISAEFYLLRNTEQRLRECDKWLQLRYKMDPPLTLVHTTTDPDNIDPDYFVLDDIEGVVNPAAPPDYEFILFDKKRLVKEFPQNRRCSLKLDQLRSLFSTHRDLHIMVLHSNTPPPSAAGRTSSTTTAPPRVPSRNVPIPPIPPREQDDIQWSRNIQLET